MQDMSDNNHNQLEFKWVRDPNQKGERRFTFDGKKIYSLFRDYPHALSDGEKEIFDKANPFWAEFFKGRK